MSRHRQVWLTLCDARNFPEVEAKDKTTQSPYQNRKHLVTSEEYIKLCDVPELSLLEIRQESTLF